MDIAGREFQVFMIQGVIGVGDPSGSLANEYRLAMCNEWVNCIDFF